MQLAGTCSEVTICVKHKTLKHIDIHVSKWKFSKTEITNEVDVLKNVFI